MSRHCFLDNSSTRRCWSNDCCHAHVAYYLSKVLKEICIFYCFIRHNTVTAAQCYLKSYAPSQWKSMTYLPLKLESPVPSDIDIAKKQIPKDIKQLAREIHLYDNELELYGTKKKAK